MHVATHSHSTLASLDAESYVPLETTIEIIYDAVHKHDKIPPLLFDRNTLNTEQFADGLYNIVRFNIWMENCICSTMVSAWALHLVSHLPIPT